MPASQGYLEDNLDTESQWPTSTATSQSVREQMLPLFCLGETNELGAETDAMEYGILVLVVQSCSIFWDPMDCSPPRSSVHGILQARILEWLSMPSFRGSSQLGIKPWSLTSPALAGGFFTASTIWGSSLVTGYAQIKITPSYCYITSGMAKTSGD